MKRLGRKIILFLIIALVLPIILSFFVLKPLIKNQINNRVNTISKELYSVDYKNVSVNLFNFKIIIEKPELIPDGTKLDRIKVTELYKLRANRVIISITAFYKLIFKNQFHFNNIEFINPVLKIVSLPFEKSEIETNLADFTFESVFKSKSLEVKNGNLIKFDFGKNQIEYSVENIHIKTENISIKKSFNLKNISYNNLNINLKKIIIVNDSLHTSSIKQIKISQNLKIIEIESLKISPRIGKYQLAKRYNKNIRWNSLFVQSLVFESLCFDSLQNSSILSQKLYLEKPILEVFNDKHFDLDSTIKHYFLSKLLKSPIRFKFDTIDIHKGNILLESLSDENRLPEQLHFSELSGQITDVWVSSDSIDENTEIHAHLKGYFQSVVPFEIHSYPAHYPLNWKHRGSANISTFKLSRVKKILKTDYKTIINSGTCDGLTFEYNVNKKELNGQMEFKYNNLDFDLINKKGKKDIKIAFLQRFGAFEKSNPNTSTDLARISKVHYEVKEFDGIIDIWKKGIEKGIAQSVQPNIKWKN